MSKHTPIQTHAKGNPCFYYLGTGDKYLNGKCEIYGEPWNNKNGNIVSFEFNISNQTITFYKNHISQPTLHCNVNYQKYNPTINNNNLNVFQNIKPTMNELLLEDTNYNILTLNNNINNDETKYVKNNHEILQKNKEKEIYFHFMFGFQNEGTKIEILKEHIVFIDFTFYISFLQNNYTFQYFKYKNNHCQKKIKLLLGWNEQITAIVLKYYQ